MAPSRSLNRCIVILLAATAAMAQTQDSTSATVTAAPSQAVSASSQFTGSASSDDAALSLWSVANSLLTSYYPSTTLDGVASLTWPASVVIGSSTISVHSEPTGTPSNTLSLNKPVETDSTSNGAPADNHSDKKLGIGLGVGLGLLCVAIAAFVVLCLRHKRKKHGGSGVFQRDPSVSDSEIGGWRTPMAETPMAMGTTNTIGAVPPRKAVPSREWQTKYARMSANEAPPMTMHPAYMQQRHSPAESSSISDDNPFYTPAERAEADAMLEHREMPAETLPAESSWVRNHSQRRSGSSSRPRDSSDFAYTESNRPPTPLMHHMMGGSKSPISPVQQHQRNPFYYPDDIHAEREATRQALMRNNSEAEREHCEADDVLSPIIPARHPERRHSPMVHYPSWNEVSEFDFSGSDSEHRRSLKERSSGSTGGDGWRNSQRESVVGRTELPSTKY